MGRLQTKAAEYEHKEYDWLLIESVQSGFNDASMIYEIVRTLVVTLEHIENALSECVLRRADRV